MEPQDNSTPQPHNMLTVKDLMDCTIYALGELVEYFKLTEEDEPQVDSSVSLEWHPCDDHYHITAIITLSMLAPWKGQAIINVPLPRPAVEGTDIEKPEDIAESNENYGLFLREVAENLAACFIQHMEGIRDKERSDNN